MNVLMELQDLIEAHDDYAFKREKLEEKIYNVFSGNDIHIRSVVFTKQGFDVSVDFGYWLLDNIGGIISSFNEFNIYLDYRKDYAVFKFNKKDD